MFLKLTIKVVAFFLGHPVYNFERMSQSEGRKNYFGTKTCVRANRVSFKFQGRGGDFKCGMSLR